MHFEVAFVTSSSISHGGFYYSTFLLSCCSQNSPGCILVRLLYILTSCLAVVQLALNSLRLKTGLTPPFTAAPSVPRERMVEKANASEGRDQDVSIGKLYDDVLILSRIDV